MSCVECFYLVEDERKKAELKGRLPKALSVHEADPNGLCPSFCTQHQPVVSESPVKRSGYYLARYQFRDECDECQKLMATGHAPKKHTEEIFVGIDGAVGYALAAKDLYLSHGLNPKFAGPGDGAAVHHDTNGQKFIYLTVQNFFDDHFNIYVHLVK